MRTGFLDYTALGRVAKSDRSLLPCTNQFLPLPRPHRRDSARDLTHVDRDQLAPTPAHLRDYHTRKPATASAIAIKRAGPLKGVDLLY